MVCEYGAQFSCPTSVCLLLCGCSLSAYYFQFWSLASDAQLNYRGCPPFLLYNFQGFNTAIFLLLHCHIIYQVQQSNRSEHQQNMLLVCKSVTGSKSACFTQQNALSNLTVGSSWSVIHSIASGFALLLSSRSFFFFFRLPKCPCFSKYV